MAQLHPQRMTAEIDGDLVVSVVGMRIEPPWKIHEWLPVFRAMPRRLREPTGGRAPANGRVAAPHASPRAGVTR